MFSDRASPSQVVGPKRYRVPPCTIHDLPHINAAVISHSHYDHLDHSTVTLLNARYVQSLNNTTNLIFIYIKRVVLKPLLFLF